jgi:ribosomal protein S12 methylthiotransferase
MPKIMLGSLLKEEGVEIANDSAQADAGDREHLLLHRLRAGGERGHHLRIDRVPPRSTRPGQAVIVSAGGMPQRFREELPKLMPEVDVFMGIDQVEQVGQLVEQAITSRQGKLQAPAQETAASKKALQAKLAELEKAKGGHQHDHEEIPPRFRQIWEDEAGHRAESRPRSAGCAAGGCHLAPLVYPQFETPRFRLTPKHFAYLKIAEGCNHPCSFCIIPRMRGSHRQPHPGRRRG